ncbi:RhuM family protein [Anaerosinus massiliensis]|uniref:RhuM family protein n=1 Tax=Massilibacillus massiliensis TaxID=1806837 RepID=UPI000DA60210|nr:RhuM family protein [Massilibacillus massiliensis]
MKKHSTVRNFRTVDTNGKTYNMAYYNLDMIISLGYRVRSQVATQFRCWATERLKKHSCKQLKKSIRLPRKRWNARNRLHPLTARWRNRMLLRTIQHKMHVPELNYRNHS